jgi:hypothetical protein
LFSDAPTAGPWSIKADVPADLPSFEFFSGQSKNGAAKVTLDRTSGTNGDKVNVTVTPITFSDLDIIYIEVVSTAMGHFHALPLFIGKM